jgi:hypothetical protein
MLKHLRDIAGVILLLVIIAGLSWRLSKRFIVEADPIGSEAAGLNAQADFRDVIYYPSRAIRDGVNPYDCRLEPLADGSPRYRLRYPILNALPLYSPLVFALFFPFSFGSLTSAAIAWVIFQLVLLVVFSHCCWKVAGAKPSVGATAFLASAMLVSQAGRANFMGGETAVPLAIGSLLAVALAGRQPWLAGFALALTSFKPTFGLPLGILLLAAGYYRTVFCGWALGGAIAIGGLVFIFAQSGDLADMPAILQHNQEVLESDPDGDPLQSPIRMDAAGALQRFLPIQGDMASVFASCVVLGIACGALFVLRRAGDAPEVQLLRNAIVAVATVSAMFHITYDAVLLWGAIVCVGLSPRSVWEHVSTRWRIVVVLLLLVPMVNVLGTKTMNAHASSLLGLGDLPSFWKQAWWTMVCTLNGLAQLTALGLMAWQAVKLARKKPDA